MSTTLSSPVIANDLAMALDPALIMRAAGMVPDSWQESLLRSQSQQDLLLCHRQAGKSTVCGALAAHAAIYQAPALILLLSPSLRQSQELFRKVMNFYDAMERPVPAREESTLRIELENDSRIIALPGNSDATVRGFSGVKLLIVDEASRVSDALYYSIRPMLAVSNGRLVCLTTPYGKRGFFHEAWESENRWGRYTFTAYENPRISRAFLEEERAAMGERWFAQEYLCEFRDTDEQVFSTESIMAALSSEVKPLEWTGFKTWQQGANT